MFYQNLKQGIKQSFMLRNKVFFYCFLLTKAKEKPKIIKKKDYRCYVV